jgi:hypothetical protein
MGMPVFGKDRAPQKPRDVTRKRAAGQRRARSPRVRGEGWGEGALPLGSESRMGPHTLVIASEAKQSSLLSHKALDCFVAEPVIGPATSGRTRWLLAMTK